MGSQTRSPDPHFSSPCLSSHQDPWFSSPVPLGILAPPRQGPPRLQLSCLRDCALGGKGRIPDVIVPRPAPRVRDSGGHVKGNDMALRIADSCRTEPMMLLSKVSLPWCTTRPRRPCVPRRSRRHHRSRRPRRDWAPRVPRRPQHCRPARRADLVHCSHWRPCYRRPAQLDGGMQVPQHLNLADGPQCGTRRTWSLASGMELPLQALPSTMVITAISCQAEADGYQRARRCLNGHSGTTFSPTLGPLMA
jgi:hypothetical protein